MDFLHKGGRFTAIFSLDTQNLNYDKRSDQEEEKYKTFASMPVISVYD